MWKLFPTSAKLGGLIFVLALALSMLLISFFYPRPKDHRYIIAEKSFAEGEELRALGDVESQRKAINKYEEASQAWRNANDEKKEADALKKIGELYFPLGDVQIALKYYEQALRLYRKLNDQQGEGETLNAAVSVYLSRGENGKAMEYCDLALKIGRATDSRRIEALVDCSKSFRTN